MGAKFEEVSRIMIGYGIVRGGEKADRVAETAFGISVIAAILSLIALPLWPLYNDHFVPGIPIVSLSLLGCAVIGGVTGLISWLVMEYQQGTYGY